MSTDDLPRPDEAGDEDKRGERLRLAASADPEDETMQLDGQLDDHGGQREDEFSTAADTE